MNKVINISDISVNLMKKINNYKITFVLPGINIKYPPGGYDIVYRLSNTLNKNKIKTAIIFCIPDYIENSKTKNFKYSVYKIFRFVFYGKRLKYIYKHWRFVNKILFKTDYNYDILKNTDCYLYNKGDNIKFNTDIIIATSWETAYYVNGYIKNHNAIPYYLVQHNEDDVSFSGNNSIDAKKTYDFNFKKIVINKKVYARFSNEKPLFFHVGIDNKFYRIIDKIADRNCIMFPLRKGESKGAKYAIKCIEKLLNNNKNIKIIAFGDYKNDEIPDNIKNKIDYYYKPSRRLLLELYNKSIIFVLPSIVEGMSLPPLEAMSCGCAVVVTDNGGVNEYIKDNINGVMCPVRDSNCLYEKIIYLLNNNDIRNKIIKNGLETSKEYSYENMENNFINIVKTKMLK